MTVSPAAREILDFWLGDAVGGDEQALNNAFERWFGGSSEIDERVRARFGAQVGSALEGGFEEWEGNVRARLALILLLDQFPRNVFRRTARAFAGDARALKLARQAVARGEDRELSLVERVFLLMPFQHAEDLDAQREGVALFRELAQQPAPPYLRKLLESSLKFAEKHHDIISQFDRFPYRNEALGRTPTAKEKTWLEKTSVRFGQ